MISKPVTYSSCLALKLLENFQVEELNMQLSYDDFDPFVITVTPLASSPSSGHHVTKSRSKISKSPAPSTSKTHLIRRNPQNLRSDRGCLGYVPIQFCQPSLQTKGARQINFFKTSGRPCTVKHKSLHTGSKLQVVSRHLGAWQIIFFEIGVGLSLADLVKCGLAGLILNTMKTDNALLEICLEFEESEEWLQWMVRFLAEGPTFGGWLATRQHLKLQEYRFNDFANTKQRKLQQTHPWKRKLREPSFKYKYFYEIHSTPKVAEQSHGRFLLFWLLPRPLQDSSLHHLHHLDLCETNLTHFEGENFLRPRSEGKGGIAFRESRS